MHSECLLKRFYGVRCYSVVVLIGTRSRWHIFFPCVLKLYVAGLGLLFIPVCKPYFSCHFPERNEKGRGEKSPEST